MITSALFPPLAWYDGGLMTERGTFMDPILPTGSWRVPGRLELIVDQLVSASSLDQPSQERTTGPGLLDGFARLSEGDATDVLRFARKWGVLAICEHGY